MKKLSSLILGLLCALCSVQATAAVLVVNNTTHKIETNRMEVDGHVGHSITIDGKKTIFGDLFIMAGGTQLSVEDLTEMSSMLPAILHDVEKLEFSNSMICPGSGSAEVIEVFVTADKDNSYLLCLASGEEYGKNLFYVAFDIRH